MQAPARLREWGAAPDVSTWFVLSSSSCSSCSSSAVFSRLGKHSRAVLFLMPSQSKGSVPSQVQLASLAALAWRCRIPRLLLHRKLHLWEARGR